MQFFKGNYISLVVFSLILVGCGGNVDESSYEKTIEDGLDYFAVEKYSEAEVQFELALKEKEDDELAKALLAQTVAFRKSLKLFEEGNFDEGFIQAKTVVETTSGSTSISNKAEELINNQNAIQEKIGKETEEVHKNGAAEKFAKEKAERDKKEKEEADQHAEAGGLTNSEKTKYEYSDFIGYYLHFDSSDRSHSDTVAGIGHNQVVVAWWGGEGNEYDILDKSIEDNTLTIDYYTSNPYTEDERDYGTMKIILNETDGEHSVEFDFDPEMDFYKVSYEEILSYDYSIIDFVN